jgi:hypothetical protein
MMEKSGAPRPKGLQHSISFFLPPTEQLTFARGINAAVIALAYTRPS